MATANVSSSSSWGWGQRRCDVLFVQSACVVCTVLWDVCVGRVPVSYVQFCGVGVRCGMFVWAECLCHMYSFVGWV